MASFWGIHDGITGSFIQKLISKGFGRSRCWSRWGRCSDESFPLNPGCSMTDPYNDFLSSPHNWVGKKKSSMYPKQQNGALFSLLIYRKWPSTLPANLIRIDTQKKNVERVFGIMIISTSRCGYFFRIYSSNFRGVLEVPS